MTSNTLVFPRSSSLIGGESARGSHQSPLPCAVKRCEMVCAGEGKVGFGDNWLFTTPPEPGLSFDIKSIQFQRIVIEILNYVLILGQVRTLCTVHCAVCRVVKMNQIIGNAATANEAVAPVRSPWPASLGHIFTAGGALFVYEPCQDTVSGRTDSHSRQVSALAPSERCQTGHTSPWDGYLPAADLRTYCREHID